ncbi:MAG: hypothetical protein HC871_12705 [Rhizobiales bacterium]|nr:hypothetical protein [Hyphomicrobiales bacterium]
MAVAIDRDDDELDVEDDLDVDDETPIGLGKIDPVNAERAAIAVGGEHQGFPWPRLAFPAQGDGRPRQGGEAKQARPAKKPPT